MHIITVIDRKHCIVLWTLQYATGHICSKSEKSSTHISYQV